jgi:hypothetical protein
MDQHSLNTIADLYDLTQFGTFSPQLTRDRLIEIFQSLAMYGVSYRDMLAIGQVRHFYGQIVTGFSDTKFIQFAAYLQARLQLEFNDPSHRNLLRLAFGL